MSIVWVALAVLRSICRRKMALGNHDWCICFNNCNTIFGADTDALKRKNYLALQANFFIVILRKFNKLATCFCQIAVTTYVSSSCGYFYYLIKFVSIVSHCDASQQPFTRPKISHEFHEFSPCFLASFDTKITAFIQKVKNRWPYGTANNIGGD